MPTPATRPTVTDTPSRCPSVSRQQRKREVFDVPFSCSPTMSRVAKRFYRVDSLYSLENLDRGESAQDENRWVFEVSHEAANKGNKRREITSGKLSQEMRGRRHTTPVEPAQSQEARLTTTCLLSVSPLYLLLAFPAVFVSWLFPPVVTKALAMGVEGSSWCLMPASSELCFWVLFHNCVFRCCVKWHG